MRTSLKICYNNFIKGVMSSTGLPLSQMQTFIEWVYNRKNQFKTEASEYEKFLGFETWLLKQYGNR